MTLTQERNQKIDEVLEEWDAVLKENEAIISDIKTRPLKEVS